jgi:hypothetical protein
VALLNLDGVGGLDAAITAPGEEVAGDVAGSGSGLLTVALDIPSGLFPLPDTVSGQSLNDEEFALLHYGQRIGAPHSGGPIG